MGGVFVCRPRAASAERACARQILSRVARQAYRRPVTAADLDTLLEFFDSGRREGGSFEAGVQLALERVLVDPDFLLRVHRDTGAGVGPVRAGLAAVVLSRGAASPTRGCWTSPRRARLTDPVVLAREVRRMLADRRAGALVTDFAAQWLNLRRLPEVVVDPERYPTYDESLLQAFQRETELFVGSTIDEDRKVTDLLTADYTFVNERLARHYGIPGIYGSRFRRVTLPDRRQRGGLLAPRRAAGHDLVSRSHLAGAAREVHPQQHPGAADAATAGRRGHEPGRAQARHRGAVDSRAPGRSTAPTRRARAATR